MSNKKRVRGEIENRLRENGDLDAANYIAQLEGEIKEANERQEAARVALVLHTRDLLRTLKRWGMTKPTSCTNSQSSASSYVEQTRRE